MAGASVGLLRRARARIAERKAEAIARAAAEIERRRVEAATLAAELAARDARELAERIEAAARQRIEAAERKAIAQKHLALIVTVAKWQLELLRARGMIEQRRAAAVAAAVAAASVHAAAEAAVEVEEARAARRARQAAAAMRLQVAARARAARLRVAWARAAAAEAAARAAARKARAAELAELGAEAKLARAYVEGRAPGAVRDRQAPPALPVSPGLSLAQTAPTDALRENFSASGREMPSLREELPRVRAYAQGHILSARGSVGAALSSLARCRISRANARELRWLAEAWAADTMHAAHALAAASRRAPPPPAAAWALPWGVDVRGAREMLGAGGARLLVVALPPERASAAEFEPNADAQSNDHVPLVPLGLRLARTRSLGSLAVKPLGLNSAGPLRAFAVTLVAPSGRRGAWRRRETLALLSESGDVNTRSGTGEGAGVENGMSDTGSEHGDGGWGAASRLGLLARDGERGGWPSMLQSPGESGRSTPQRSQRGKTLLAARLPDSGSGSRWHVALGAVWPASMGAGMGAGMPPGIDTLSATPVLRYADWQFRARVWRAPGSNAPQQLAQLPQPLAPASRLAAPSARASKEAALAALDPARPAALPRLLALVEHGSLLPRPEPAAFLDAGEPPLSRQNSNRPLLAPWEGALLAQRPDALARGGAPLPHAPLGWMARPLGASS
ncbi:hypothetical protein T492DRAFT_1148277 [Pavlovales sp. CCMP2436]|nr:hypothetical protein T492DRAFT_1148277 [Pavlovales sp. CCMP2436]